MTTQSMIALTAVLGVALLVVGCGGGSSALTKAEFAKQGNVACQKARANAMENVTGFLKEHSSEGKPTPVLNADMVKAVVLPEIEAQIKAIEELDPPPAQKKSVEQFMRLEREEIGEIKGLSHAATYEAVEAHFIPSAKLARANGLTSCANGPEPVS